MTQRRKSKEVISKILDFVTIDQKALNLARSRWDERKDIRSVSFEKEQQRGDKEQLIDDMFNGTFRLIDECETLSQHVSLHNNGLPKDATLNTSFVLDAALFSDFAQIDASPQYIFRGFNFLSERIRSCENFNTEIDQDMVERNYFVGLLRELFRMGFPIGITDAGLGELGNLPSQFLKKTEEMSKTEYQKERLQQAQRHAEQLSNDIDDATQRIETITSFFGLKESDRAKLTNEAFCQIANSIAIPSSINNYKLARLNYALRSTQKKLGRVQAIVAENLRSHGKEADAYDFEFICRKLALEHRHELNEARRTMEHAYSVYLTEYWGKTELGQGQLENVSALFEIHLINCILDKLNIEHSARYIHKHFDVYGFLRGFARGRVFVPSLHPRFAFFFARPEILLEQVQSGKDVYRPEEHVGVVTTAVSSFKSRILSDKKISSDEYEIFSETTQPLLNQLQDMHCSLLIEAGEFEEEDRLRAEQAKAAYDELVDYFTKIQKKCDKYQDEWEQQDEFDINSVRLSIEHCLHILEKIRDQLQDSLLITKVALADNIDQARSDYKENSAYSITSILHMDKCVQALNEITQKNSEASSYKLLVSAYRPNKKPKPIRLTVIPLSGAYRYLFTLFSKELAQHISSELDEGKIGTQAFCKEVITYVNKYNYTTKKNTSAEKIILLSCKYLVSAFQSANLKNWSLSLKLVETAIGYIDDALKSSQAKNKSDATNAKDQEINRNNLTAQKIECIALQQVALRALAEETHEKSRKRKHLEAAFSRLEYGLELLSQVTEDTYKVKTSMPVQAIRFFAGRIAIEVEKDLNIFKGIFPDNLSYSWKLWGETPSKNYPQIDADLINELENLNNKAPTKEKYAQLREFCKPILNECLKNYHDISKGKLREHTAYIWASASLRVAQVIDFVQLVEFIQWDMETKNFADYNLYSHNASSELQEIRNNLSQKDRETLSQHTASESNLYDDWRFMMTTHSYFELCKKLSDSNDPILDLDHSPSWAKLKSSSSHLVQTGLPYYVINKLMEGIKKENEMRIEDTKHKSES